MHVAEAGGEVVVDHAGGLHVGVDDGGADEVEAAVFEVFAEGVGEGGAGGDFFEGLPGILEGAARLTKAPDVGVEGGEFVPGF